MPNVSLSADFAWFRTEEHVVLNNTWGNGGLRNGRDYSQTISFDSNDIAGTLTFDWAWPVGGQSVLAYPEIGWGDTPLYDGVEECHDYVSRIAHIETFTVDVDIDITNGSDFGNVAFDLWLTKKAFGDAQSVTTELMVWLDHSTLDPIGQKVGTIGSGSDKATVYRHENHDTGTRVFDYIAVVYNEPHLDGEVDLRFIMKKLAAMDLISSRNFVGGYELGAEIAGGSGSLRFNRMETRFEAEEAQAKVLEGTSAADSLEGLSGGDTITGFGGADTIHGGAGDDSIEGGAGADRMNGGGGTDTLDYGSSGAYVAIDLEANSAWGGDATGDWIMQFENVSGSAFNDILGGSGGGNILKGLAGDDRLEGRAGSDLLIGGAGSDQLAGGTGRDELRGGGGGDIFQFQSGDSLLGARDEIADFSLSEGDRIRLSSMDADTTREGSQPFVFIGSAAFSGAAGELRYEAVGGNTSVLGDTNGDGAADVAIQLRGTYEVSASYFLL